MYIVRVRGPGDSTAESRKRNASNSATPLPPPTPLRFKVGRRSDVEGCPNVVIDCGVWVGLRASLDAVDKREIKILLSFLESNPDSWVI
jgi:hypothetical protein